MLDNVLEAVGNTPLLHLAGLDAGLPGKVYAKLENRNPGGSIKDRVALHLLRSALCDGSVAPGGTVLEATSGNMGIGIALAARAMGLKAVLCMPETMSVERRKLMQGFGAEVVLTPGAEGMKGAIEASKRLAAE
ncbi:MAG: pyridoxal-phosphate dependent enzyme, partial [Desulfovibrio sp.]|nr:pyridoxal-phosphate dependent enzyme [Desulfovibrio sp.]